MQTSLTGKVIAISGAAGEIGRAVASACARDGSHLILIDDKERLDVLRGIIEKIEVYDAQVCFTSLAGDAASPITHAVENAADRLGHVDGLVTCGAAPRNIGLESGAPEEFWDSVQSQVLPHYLLTEALLPYLRKARGAIVNVCSNVPITGRGGRSDQAASDGAILGLTTQRALELSPDGIRVNAVIRVVGEPAGTIDDWGTSTQQLASTVLFLLSSNCGMSGQEVHVDRGYVHLDRQLTQAQSC